MCSEPLCSRSHIRPSAREKKTREEKKGGRVSDAAVWRDTRLRIAIIRLIEPQGKDTEPFQPQETSQGAWKWARIKSRRTNVISTGRGQITSNPWNITARLKRGERMKSAEEEARIRAWVWNNDWGPPSGNMDVLSDNRNSTGFIGLHYSVITTCCFCRVEKTALRRNKNTMRKTTAPWKQMSMGLLSAMGPLRKSCPDVQRAMTIKRKRIFFTYMKIFFKQIKQN